MSAIAEEHQRNQDSQQRKAFSRWVLLHVEKSSTLPDEFRDAKALEDNMASKFKNGILLAELAQSLTHTKISKLSTKEAELFYQQNLGSALSTLEHDGCPLLNIHATTLSTGTNERMVLGLLWQLIQAYTLASTINDVLEPEPEPEPVQQHELSQQTSSPPSSTKAPKKKTGTMTINLADIKNHMIEFVNEQISKLTPEQRAEVIQYTCHPGGELRCTNLDKDWKTSGLLFALIASLHEDPEIISLLKTESNNTPCQQLPILQACLQLANRDMGIPSLLDAEDMTHSVEANTMLTYLSYYLNLTHKPKAPKKVFAPLPAAQPVEEPAPVVEEPAPVVEEPAPVVQPVEQVPPSLPPAPVVEVPAPQVLDDEAALLSRETATLSAVVAKKDQSKPNFTTEIAQLRDLVHDMKKFKSEAATREHSGYNTQLTNRMDGHVKRIESTIEFLQYTQAVLDKPAPEPVAPQENPPPPPPTSSQLQEQPKQQPESQHVQAPKQDDLNLYLIIALIIAILAFLIK